MAEYTLKINAETDTITWVEIDISTNYRLQAGGSPNPNVPPLNNITWNNGFAGENLRIESTTDVVYWSG